MPTTARSTPREVFEPLVRTVARLNRDTPGTRRNQVAEHGLGLPRSD